MAERVDRFLELGLNDLKSLEAIGLCSYNEVVSIISIRRQHEYKLSRSTPLYRCYIRYIQYETYLYILLSNRSKLSCLPSTSFSDISRLISKRLNSLYQRILFCNISNLQLFLQYADFCKRTNNFYNLKRITDKALVMYPFNSCFWVLSSLIALHIDNDSRRARYLLLSGIQFVPKSQHLWIELCRLELLHTHKIRLRKEVKISYYNIQESCKFASSKINSKILKSSANSCKSATVVFKRAVDVIGDNINFEMIFLHSIYKYPHAKYLSSIITNRIKNNPKLNPFYYEFISKRLCEVNFHSNDQKFINDLSSFILFNTDTSLRSVCQFNIDVTTFQQVIAYVIEHSLSKKSSQDLYAINNILLSLLNNSLTNGILSEQNLYEYYKFLIQEELYDMIEEAIPTHLPEILRSPALLKVFFENMIKGNNLLLNYLYNGGKDKLFEIIKGLPFDSVIHLTNFVSDNGSKLFDYFVFALFHLIEDYLTSLKISAQTEFSNELTSLTKSLLKLCLINPFRFQLLENCYELIKKIFKWPKALLKIDIKKQDAMELNSLYEPYTKYYGSNEIEVWIKWIWYLRENLHIQYSLNVYSMALNNLEFKYIQNFIEKYQLLN